MEQDAVEKANRRDAKGKGVELNNDPSSPSSSAEHELYPGSAEAPAENTSMASRLGTSATKLARDIIPWRPSSADMASAAPSNKPECSRAGRAAGMDEAQIHRDNASQAVIDSNAFKSAETPEQRTSGESMFSSFVNSTSALEATEPRGVEGRDRKHSPDNDEVPPKQRAPTAVISTADGIEVANFLDSGYHGIEELPPISEVDRGQATAPNRIPEGGNSERRPWGGRLNFFPDFGPDSNSIQQYAELLGTPNLDEARSIWVSQWEHVLSSYTDEVWGDFIPLVSAAREELRSLSESPGGTSQTGLKALHRLRQILAHVGT
ncbi:hypothetical protein GGS23DRAFT_557122 [Durotheca rogersii]|uniref:uncharacterized protein n=1 Tax=Durotheca rogersii TaxID=419775 RepID=UPI00221E88C9|nr:uncharacterized protein GGS23DRAFT_557122 [Durotheca rogersii]KAI5864990.1 hypothetical protein GGS23DRAFT_557122 [Durotheca rogersii]